MHSTKTVYLDTQDYSRFGDVLRDKSDRATTNLFNKLIEIRTRGDARFVLSMPILSELLQYSDETKDICLAKADAAEQLCGKWAVPFPTRSIAMEIAEALAADGAQLKAPVEYISSRRYWYPDLGDMMGSMRSELRRGVDEAFAKFEPKTFTQKRKLKKLRSKIDLNFLLKIAKFEEVEAEIGVPASVLSKAIVPLLRGRITPQEASHRLFESVAEPRRFVDLFFGRGHSGAEELPVWLRGVGDKLKDSIERSVQPVLETIDQPFARDIVAEIFANEAQSYKPVIPKLGYEGLEEFLVHEAIPSTVDLPNDVLDRIPSANIVAQAFHGYMEQILGLAGMPAKFERSVAGDLIHLIYLPHVDLWRGDRRFSAVLHRKLPELKDKVVARLSDLPDRILR